MDILLALLKGLIGQLARGMDDSAMTGIGKLVKIAMDSY